MKQITIVDIARQAGVSVSTVSRVINGSKKVSDELCKRVEQVIQENNFKPNSIARGLVTKTTHVIGIVLPDISNPIFYNLIKGVDAILAPQNYSFILCESQGRAELEKNLLHMLKERNIDGIIFAGVTVDQPLLDVMHEINIPIVLVCQDPDPLDCGFDVVNFDNFRMGYEATNFLIQNGHRRIAMISGPLYDNSSGKKRFWGYQKALEEAGISYAESYVRFGKFTFEEGYNGMKQIYEENLQLPTAVLASCDEAAMGAIDFLLSCGVQVPEQISVMGTTEIPMSSYYRPAITTVRIFAYDIGRKASELIIKRINREAGEPRYHEIDFKIMRRNSVKVEV